MDNKIYGIGIIIAALLLLGVIVSFKMQIGSILKQEVEQNQGVCIIDGECIHDKNAMPIQTYGGIIVSSLLLALGIYLAAFGNKNQAKSQEPRMEKADLESAIKASKEEERIILKHVIDSDGTIFQSDLVDKTGFSKVKVTRILDALEGRNIIERRRRGMTNVVILKHENLRKDKPTWQPTGQSSQ